MKIKLIALTCSATLASITTSFSAVALIDVGQSGTQTTSPTTGGIYWNNMATLSTTTAANLIDTSGDDTGWDWAITNSWFGSSPANNGGETVYVESATTDFLFIDRNYGDQMFQMELTGLDDTGATSYSFNFFISSSRTAPEEFISNYTVTGLGTGSTASLEAIGNTSNIATISGVLADATGKIVIDVGLNPGSNFAGIGVLEITSSPVPEPSSTALLGLGGIALILRRRMLNK